MKLYWLFVVGTLVQAAGLLGFILVSRSAFALGGKPTVYAATALCVGVIIWREIRHGANWVALIRVSGVLAVGYVVAFFLVGMFGFRGLLSGAEFSSDEVISMVRVGGAVFVMYSIGAAVLLLASRLWRPKPPG